MSPSSVGPPFDQFLATGEAVAQARPEADPEMAREVLQELATLLHDGALDGLDVHDAGVAVARLSLDLVAADPGAAVRARSRAVIVGPRARVRGSQLAGLHPPPHAPGRPAGHGGHSHTGLSPTGRTEGEL